jgi:three-Cys-motif partner protein
VSDSLGTIWPADPHTLAKHGILRRYLDAWLPILTRQAALLRKQFGNLNSREILYIDGFAGPGKYSGGERGSPVIALEAAIQHNAEFPIPVRMLFIELEKSRFEHLRTVLEPHLANARNSNNVHAADPRHGECDEVLHEMLNQYEKSNIKFGPALAFLDQFGYGAVSMNLIKRIMSYPQCEVFTYLNFKDMNRWISDPNKAAAFTRAFGGDDWRECIELHEKPRREKLLELYKNALRDPKRAGAKHVVSFLMFDNMGIPLYWLLFCTNSLRGLEEMKKAMWTVDRSGEFRFSDKENPDQLKLLDESFDDKWLAGELRSRLAGRTMTAMEIKEYVLVETPCYLFKAALKSLESSKIVKIIAAPVERKPGTFPDERLTEIRLNFSADLFGGL